MEKNEQNSTLTDNSSGAGVTISAANIHEIWAKALNIKKDPIFESMGSISAASPEDLTLLLLKLGANIGTDHVVSAGSQFLGVPLRVSKLVTPGEAWLVSKEGRPLKRFKI